MNTYMTFTVYRVNPETALAEAKDIISALGQLWSVTDEHSEIYAVNHMQRGSRLRLKD